jgi:protoporphyrinogen oxidase
MEYWCQDEDEVWAYEEEQLVGIARKEIVETGLVADSEVLAGKVVRVPKCYPIYEKGYEVHLEKVQRFMDSIPQIHPIGRYGSFKYNNQDHSILMGLLAAENLTHGANHDLWGVNTDYEYQESSRITSTGLIED